jgi:transposase-like protein
MKIDPEKHEKVLMPCKRGTDQMTKGQACDSKNAYKLTATGSRAPSFQCAKCGFQWIVPTGGSFVI